MRWWRTPTAWAGPVQAASEIIFRRASGPGACGKRFLEEKACLSSLHVNQLGAGLGVFEETYVFGFDTNAVGGWRRSQKKK